MNTAKKWIAAFSAGLFSLSACPLLTSVQAANADRKQDLSTMEEILCDRGHLYFLWQTTVLCFL